MSWIDYRCLDAFIEEDQVGYDDNGLLCRLVSVLMTDDTMTLDPAVCRLTVEEARELASGLLACAGHAEQLTREHRSGR
jgi:hypothetical protein